MDINHFTTSDLTQIAHQTMIDRNLNPDYSAEVNKQLSAISGPAPLDPSIKDRRSFLWCSIDNDDSQDLDQLTYAEKLKDFYKIYIAIADVDALVKPGSPIYEHAKQNTTSVYTPTKVFSMLPEKLSTNYTSLGENQDRAAIVIEVTIDQDGCQKTHQIYRASVHNYAKLAYNSVSKWLTGEGLAPAKVAASKGLDEQLRLQDQIAQLLKAHHHEEGSLSLVTIEPQVIVQNGKIFKIQSEQSNRANELIEFFMIEANTASSLFLQEKKFPVLRRVVKTPKYWDKIVSVAYLHATKLPKLPDSKALEDFITKQQKVDPLRFPDLSLTIIKLLGRGEYVVQFPGEAGVGHFGLALQNYSHSTAPNRRFPDIITQELLKAAIAGKPCPFVHDALIELAQHCTDQEAAADKVERKMVKCAAAFYLKDKVGLMFDGLITGTNENGNWVRLINPPIEGKVVKGGEGLNVGNKVRVKLIGVSVVNGYIDFAILSP